MFLPGYAAIPSMAVNSMLKNSGPINRTVFV